MSKLRMAIAIVVALVAAASASAANLPYASAREGYVLMQDLALWQDEFGGKLKFQEALTLGDKVALLGQTAKFTQDGREREYVKIRSLSGKEGWARSSYVASNATLAVVKVPKTLIYSEPRDVKVTSRTLGYMVLVAVFRDGGADGFVKIGGYDPGSDTLIDGVYVSRDDLTFDDFDINALVLYRVAMGMKNAELRRNLLTVAQTKYGKTIFMDKIQAALNPESQAKALVAAGGKYIVNDNNVNLRSAPDEKGGSVLKTLAKDTVVEVVQASAAAYTVGGATAQWFKLKDPEGWVFGAFLSPAP